MGIAEIARYAGVSKQVVVNWKKRSKNFPEPVLELASGPIFKRTHIRSWIRRQKKSMAHVISTINLKGGVGKTTMTVALAEALSSRYSKKVLVVDLDPQTNATVMLIGEKKWSERNKEDKTIARLFKDALSEDKKKFKLEDVIISGVSDVTGTDIDLIPSSLDLIDVQDRLASTPSGKYFSVNPVELLYKATKKIIDEYDYVFIDCPPNLGIITLNGLRISDGYIIPTIPDVLSTYGIPQIVTRVSEFADEIAEEIEPLGIIISKYQENSRVHNRTLKSLRAGTKSDAPVFKEVIKQSNNISAAAEKTGARTFKQKYGYAGHADTYIRLARELNEKLD